MKDLTKGNEGKIIFAFALPMLIGNVLQQLYTTVDGIIVGRTLGKEAMGAVMLSFPIMFLLLSFVMGITMGSTILLSQYYGAKDMRKVKRTIDTAYIFLFFSSIIITIAGLLLSGPILQLIRTPEAIIPQAKAYLNVIFAGMIFMFGYNSISAILRGLGDSKTPLYFLVISTVINIALDFLFILGFGWGVAGAAWATVVAQGISFLFGVYHLNKTHDVLRFNLKTMKFDKEIFVLSVKLGIPSGVQQMLFSFGMMALQTIVNGFGTETVAAFGAAARIDSFATMPIMNFGAAISTFVGQNIGANKPERVRRGFYITQLMSTSVAVFFGVLIALFSRYTIGWFNQDPEVIRVGSSYLRIVGPFYFLISIMFITNSSLRGAGDAMFPMISSILSLWLIRIPVAYFLSSRIGTDGIWWAIPVAWTFGFAISSIYYRSGRWKNKAVVRKPIVPLTEVEAEEAQEENMEAGQMLGEEHA
jgi:putative MATE family efflux protein